MVQVLADNQTAGDWFALRVRSNSEKVTTEHLKARGFLPFLPLYRSRRTWSNRVKDLDLPLFPGYVFCRFVVTNRLPIVSAPGVVGIVGAGRIPIALDAREIEAIRKVAGSGLPAEPWPYLKAGQIVRVDHGSLKDLEGILLDVKSKQRLLVSVSLLQRSVTVEIDRDWVSPVWRAGAGRDETLPKLRSA